MTKREQQTGILINLLPTMKLHQFIQLSITATTAIFPLTFRCTSSPNFSPTATQTQRKTQPH